MRWFSWCPKHAPLEVNETVAEMPHIFKILPKGRTLGHMLRNVSVIALPDVAVFELGVLCELFGYDRTAEGLPGYNFALCSPDGGPVSTHAGFSVTPEHDLSP